MEILLMTMKELFKVFGDYSLSSMFGNVYYMNELEILLRLQANIVMTTTLCLIKMTQII